MLQLILMCFFSLNVALIPAPALGGQTLEHVRANGVVRAGVSEMLMGFSRKDTNGHWQGFDIDFSRALAAAVLENADKVSFVTVTAPSRFPLLLSGKIDLLLRNTTYTFEREAAIGVRFAGIYFFDGQAFMVPRRSISRLADLNGATICLGRRTTHEVNLADYFQKQGWSYTPILVETLQDLKENFVSGRCQAVTADQAELIALRALVPGGAEEFVILPEIISEEPLGPVVRQDDEEWLLVVKWVLNALIEAEERGITQANALSLLESAPDPGTRRFLASNGLPEKALKLKPGWVLRVIQAGGNYGEIYERHLGSQSELKLERGLNRVWTQGGLLFSPPFR
jgi:general L-amino acid transport system substrate-binding protein